MSESNGFERRTNKKKSIILEAALELFKKQGSSKTTVSQIAREAKVSQVSIYNYFDSKEGLIEVLIRRHLDKSQELAENILDLPISFKEKLEKFIALGSQINDETDQALLKAFDWHSPIIQGIYSRYTAEKQIPFLLKFIEYGKDDGAILKELSTEAIMAYFNANMQIYSDPTLLEKGKDYISNLSHLFYYGILGKR